MAGFDKYLKLLNKKRKVEAHINLLTENEPDEGGELQIPEELADRMALKKNYQDAKKRLKALQTYKIELPKLILQPKGEQNLLSQCQDSDTTLKFQNLSAILFKAITNGLARSSEMPCALFKAKSVKRIVLVIVEGLGTRELAAITGWIDDRDPARERRSKRRLEEGEKGEPPPSKLLKTECRYGVGRSTDEGKDRAAPSGEANTPAEEEEDEANTPAEEDDEANTPAEEEDDEANTPAEEEDDEANTPAEEEGEAIRSELLSLAMPLSAPLFSVHLNSKSPTQASCDAVESIICKDLFGFTGFKVLPFVSRENIMKAVDDGDVLRQRSNAMKMIENNMPTDYKVGKHGGVNHVDRLRRRKLLLSLEDMKKYNFPLPVQGNIGFSDPEFDYLHPVVDEVKNTSPMFGIDCEMCMTKRGSELTWVSVVDEKFEVVYTKFVRPAYPIVDYLTKYSGVTKELLSSVKTKLRDIQLDLRRILPKDAILVGHHLSSDFQALKLVHPYVIDTSLIYKLNERPGVRPGLKLLTKLYLQKNIQLRTKKGHNPTEDAFATLELAHLKLRRAKGFGDVMEREATMPTIKPTQMMYQSVAKDKNLSHTSPTATFQDEAYKVDLFSLTKRFSKTSALITTKESRKRLSNYTRRDRKKFVDVSRSLPRPSDVLNEAIHLPKQYLLVCHCPMTNSDTLPADQTKEELSHVDENLAKLHQSLPDSSLVMTVFTGSPWTVTLADRSNAVVMLDLVGQDASYRRGGRRSTTFQKRVSEWA